MFEMPRYKERVSLIPGGLPQFLDFACDLAQAPRIRRLFGEERVRGVAGQDTVHLRVFRPDGEGNQVDVLDAGRREGPDSYTLDAQKTLDPWLRRWLPIPFLREREQQWDDGGESRVEYGPSNWARAWLARGDDNVLRAVLAFDMQVEEEEDNGYAALSPQDVSSHAQFRLAWRFRDNAWFLNEAWVDEWLREIWDDWKRRKRRIDENAPQLEHLASYLCVLELLNHCIRGTPVFVINPGHQNPVDVDLVLDIGNSRTTGILVETRVQSTTNLNDSYLLQLRDMDAPENVYVEPFETRVEFSEALFGNEMLSRRSGRRTQAFVWPSPVRTGPEAQRLSAFSLGAEGATGMSSPKRYLWDERNWQQSWRFNTRGAGEPYVTRGPLAQRVNSSGTPLCCMQDRLFLSNRTLRAQERESAFESLFTRSSLMMFMLAEMTLQALLTINSPGQRSRHEPTDIPRRLRQIILTLPGSMPIAEQRIYRRWARWAIHLLWEALGWGSHYVDGRGQPAANARADYRTSPQVRCNWDEATCTQLVYIYNEITRRFQGDAELFCSLAGKPRQGYGDRPCVRVATIDIGGGTTDLAVTTFRLEDGDDSASRMASRTEFRDGFNQAGDDVLRAVVQKHVLDAVGLALKEAGCPEGPAAMARLFGRDTMDLSLESRNLRSQFVRQAAVPVALGLLGAYERSDPRVESADRSFAMRDFFGPGKAPMPRREVLDHVNAQLARSCGSADFDILDLTLRVSGRRMDETVRETLGQTLTDLCEIVHIYGCDALLLTGRPSRWPAVASLVCSLLPVPADRIIPMGQYRVGGWYPFADAFGNMTDPKTTVVVGAILCALAEGQLEGFSFDTGNMALSSTARYIGQMELNSKIKSSKVWFEVDPERDAGREFEREISFSGPVSIGFRQLDAERWTTTRFYVLEAVNSEASRRHARGLPFRVRLGLRIPETGDGAEDDARGEEQRDEGEFSILDVQDRDGNQLRGVLDIRLQTLPRDEGFWLDTGCVYDPEN